MGNHIRGRFEYIDPSKISKDEAKKAERKKLKEIMENEKAVKKQCLCNHRDRKKNHTHFDYTPDGVYRICKICGGKILQDPEDLSEDKIESAAEIIYSVLSIVRTSDLEITEKFDDKITSALEVVMACPKLVTELKNLTRGDLSKKGKKKDKKKKKHKHDDFGTYYKVKY